MDSATAQELLELTDEYQGYGKTLHRLVADREWDVLDEFKALLESRLAVLGLPPIGDNNNVNGYSFYVFRHANTIANIAKEAAPDGGRAAAKRAAFSLAYDAEFDIVMGFLRGCLKRRLEAVPVPAP